MFGFGWETNNLGRSAGNGDNTHDSENVALATSPMHGLDVFAYAPNSPGAEEYKALTVELLKSGFFNEREDK